LKREKVAHLCTYPLFTGHSTLQAHEADDPAAFSCVKPIQGGTMSPMNEPRNSSQNQDLTSILEKIPTQWGRSIDCGPGWYQLVIDLDRSLAATLPPFPVLQVKEKFGTLRFYWSCEQASDEQRVAANSLVAAAELRSASTCENCAAPGQLCAKDGWLKTLCTSCAAEFGYTSE
jgi:hypothetical protein